MTYSESPFSQLSYELWHVFGGRRRFPTTRDPTDRPDRDAFQRLISFEPSYRLENGFRHFNTAPFQHLKLANFGIFAGGMNMVRGDIDVYTNIVTFPRSTEVIRGH